MHRGIPSLQRDEQPRSLLPTTITTPLSNNNLLKSLGDGDILNHIGPTRQHLGGVIGVEGENGLGRDGAVDGRVWFLPGGWSRGLLVFECVAGWQLGSRSGRMGANQ